MTNTPDQVRWAGLQDCAAVLGLLREFAEQSQVGFRPWQSQDNSRISQLIINWQQNHYMRVLDTESGIQGMIIAERGQDFWDPERQLLQERAWYVRPHARDSRGSVKLWQTWSDDVAAVLARQQVNAVIMSTQGHTAFDPGRRGWRLIEKTWIRETA